MPSRFAHSRIVTHLLALSVGVAMAWTAMPLWREAVMHFNQERYGILVEQCDMAMQDHFAARQEAEMHPSPQAKAMVSAGELGLVTCQDYDIYQKRLMQWGLRESELAQMRLIAIEARASDLDDVVKIHEIQF